MYLIIRRSCYHCIVLIYNDSWNVHACLLIVKLFNFPHVGPSFPSLYTAGQSDQQLCSVWRCEDSECLFRSGSLFSLFVHNLGWQIFIFRILSTATSCALLSLWLAKYRKLPLICTSVIFTTEIKYKTSVGFSDDKVVDCMNWHELRQIATGNKEIALCYGLVKICFSFL